MQLSRALRIKSKEIVAFVGGGGKTTALFRLAEELVAQNKRVITTTTTRIFAAQIKLAPAYLTLTPLPPSPLLNKIQERGRGLGEWGEVLAALAKHPHTLIIGAETEDGKARGIAPEMVDEIAALENVDALIYEADGARMRAFKAPADHEPVLTSSTTLLVPVVGITALEKKLDDAHIHRAEIVARLTGARLGARVTPQMIARVLASERGGLKNKPPRARVAVLINQVEDDAQLESARALARLLLGTDAIRWRLAQCAAQKIQSAKRIAASPRLSPRRARARACTARSNNY
ncbi:MAG: putative selenium-dependent hydroxylase accessory protein YqeC [Chloroflexi bacterium]|nr:putative selenium-dependent hydroxylase accessory protein YqeC [Chloroflexota bacterium]